MKKLSIIIPAYNEQATIGPLLRRVLAVETVALGYETEVVVVDDGSSDGTLAAARGVDGVRCLRQGTNQGKGRAVQRGVRECSGDFVLVQDADLEYDPADHLVMLDALERCGSEPAAIYGSRVLGQIERGGARRLLRGKHPRQGLGPYLAGLALSAWTFLLYGRFLTDTLTGYKLYPAAILRGFRIRTCGFETDHEITAKLCRAGVAIREVPVAYEPRGVHEGKKIGARDGFRALWTLLRFRFMD